MISSLSIGVVLKLSVHVVAAAAGPDTHCSIETWRGIMGITCIRNNFNL